MNISDLNKAAVLAALYNGAKPLGMGFLHYDPEPMTDVEAQTILDEYPTVVLEDYPAIVPQHAKEIYFDYLKGRVMKIDLAKDEVDTRLYNRDNGSNAAENIVDRLRLTGLSMRSEGDKK